MEKTPKKGFFCFRGSLPSKRRECPLDQHSGLNASHSSERTLGHQLAIPYQEVDLKQKGGLSSETSGFCVPTFSSFPYQEGYLELRGIVFWSFRLLCSYFFLLCQEPCSGKSLDTKHKAPNNPPNKHTHTHTQKTQPVPSRNRISMRESGYHKEGWNSCWERQRQSSSSTAALWSRKSAPTLSARCIGMRKRRW